MNKTEFDEIRARYTEKFPQGYQYSQARVDVLNLIEHITQLEARLSKAVELPLGAELEEYTVNKHYADDEKLYHERRLFRCPDYPVLVEIVLKGG